MHPIVARSIQEIDAALFNGDTFDDLGDRAELVSYVERWAKELADLEHRARLKHLGEVLDKESSEGWKALGSAGADFIRSQLRRPSSAAPVRIRADGAWMDDRGVVHVVNAMWIEPDIDLGRETACGSAAWDPDNPRDYPAVTDAVVDCMTCVVRLARLCP